MGRLDLKTDGGAQSSLSNFDLLYIVLAQAISHCNTKKFIDFLDLASVESFDFTCKPACDRPNKLGRSDTRTTSSRALAGDILMTISSRRPAYYGSKVYKALSFYREGYLKSRGTFLLLSYRFQFTTLCTVRNYSHSNIGTFVPHEAAAFYFSSKVPVQVFTPWYLHVFMIIARELRVKNTYTHQFLAD